MDDALAQIRLQFYLIALFWVLILVVMDDALAHLIALFWQEL